MQHNQQQKDGLKALALVTATVAITLVTSPAEAQGATAPATNEFNAGNIQTLSNGLAFYALLACLAGICISAGLWAMGSKGRNPGTELAGKNGLILCCTAAFFVGATPTWLNYLQELGNDPSVDTAGVNSRNIPVINAGSAVNGAQTNSPAPPNPAPTTAPPSPTAEAAPLAPGALAIPTDAAPQEVKDLNDRYKVVARQHRDVFRGLSADQWAVRDQTPEVQDLVSQMVSLEEQLRAKGYRPYLG